MSWFKRRLQEKLLEKQPLPVGRSEFHSWAERIIKAAMLPVPVEDQKYILANVIASNCGPSVAFESDAYFINYLRKAAANQIAVAIRDEIYAEKKAKLAAEKQNNGAVGAPQGTDGKPVLEIAKVPST